MNDCRGKIILIFLFDVLLNNITVRAGVNNAFAEDAPLSTNVGTGTGNNTYPGLFDVNRFYFEVNLSLLMACAD